MCLQIRDHYYDNSKKIPMMSKAATLLGKMNQVTREHLVKLVLQNIPVCRKAVLLCSSESFPRLAHFEYKYEPFSSIVIS